MNSRQLLKWIIISGCLVIAAILYRNYNPAGNFYFPKCLFNEFTGYKCAGCGSQRAVHYLLNFNFLKAFKENPVFVISIPYVITGFTFDLIKDPSEKALQWRKLLFGKKAIYVVSAIILVFWVLRNIAG